MPKVNSLLVTPERPRIQIFEYSRGNSPDNVVVGDEFVEKRAILPFVPSNLEFWSLRLLYFYPLVETKSRIASLRL